MGRQPEQVSDCDSCSTHACRPVAGVRTQLLSARRTVGSRTIGKGKTVVLRGGRRRPGRLGRLLASAVNIETADGANKMYVKRMAAAAVIASGVGMAALTCGVGLVNAAPLDPAPPCPNCQPGPDGAGNAPGSNPTPHRQPPAKIPCSGGGNPRGGGGAHPCPN